MMNRSIQESIDAILNYWFGPLDDDGWPIADKNRLWFGGDSNDDDYMRQTFSDLVEQAKNNELNNWRVSDEGSMAFIIITDQMTRAIYRGHASAFCADYLALQVCHQGLSTKRDEHLPLIWRCFYYLPLEHSENLDNQNRCVRLFENLIECYPYHHQVLAKKLQYAIAHRDIIAEFGRFPHRNAILDRSSTFAERQYLKSNKENFGQSFSDDSQGE